MDFKFNTVLRNEDGRFKLKKKRSVKFVLINLGKLDKAANILIRHLIAGMSITFVCFASYT